MLVRLPIARLDRAIFEPVEVNDAVETTLTLLEPLMGGSIRVVRDYGTLPPVAAMPAG